MLCLFIVDVVYLCGPKPDHDDVDLKFSLRSVNDNFLGASNVFVVGHVPGWVETDVVGCVDVEQNGDGNGRTKYENAYRNLEAICEDDRVGESFVLFNDDFFVVEPIWEIPTYNGGLLEVFAREVARRTGRGSYFSNLVRSAKIVEKYGKVDRPLSFSLHVPMVIEKDKLRWLLAWLKGLDGFRYGLHLRTIYANMFYSDFGRTISDVKIYDKKIWLKHTLFVSTSDASFAGCAGQMIRGQFAMVSPYEKTYNIAV